MNRQISKAKAISIAIMIIAIGIILSIWPLRVWTRGAEDLSGGSPNGITEVVDSTHDAIQDIVARYDRIESIDVYVNSLERGRYMYYTFWDVDNWKVMYDDVIDLGEEGLPGYVKLPLGLDLEVGGNYRLLMTVWNAGYTLGTVDIPGDAANPSFGTFYYQDTTVESSKLMCTVNYELPISKSLSLVIMAVVAALAIGAILLLKAAGDKLGYISVQKSLITGLLPVSTVIYLLLAVMVFPMKLFDSRISDIVFYELGLVITYLYILYGLLHKREGESGSLELSFGSSIYDNLTAYGRMIAIAFAMSYACEYMNGLYNIFHTISERQMVLCLLIALVLGLEKKALVNIYNPLIVLAAGFAGYRYYQKGAMGIEEKEYDLNNLALKLIIAIAVVGLILAIGLIRSLAELIIKKKYKKLPSFTITGIAMILTFALMIVFRNGRSWGITLTVLAALFAISYALGYAGNDDNTGRRDDYIRIVTGAMVLQMLMAIIWTLLRRYYVGFVSGRFGMLFHTVTVTAEYLTVMQAVSAALLIARFAACSKKKGLGSALSASWKELGLFGFISAYMIFTVSRTGFLAVGMTIIVMLLVAAFAYRRNVLIAAISMVIAAALAFPAAFTLQRMIPVMVGRPVFYEIDDATPQTRGSGDWDDTEYISIERFGTLFTEKILGRDGADYDYPEDPMNYDDEGNKLYDEDGFPLSLLDIRSLTDLWTIRAYAEDLDEDGGEESDGDGDYTNGRTTIWRAYIDRLSMTGSAETGITLEDGEPVIHAHNVYLQFANDHGIIAGLLFAIMIFCLGLRSIVYCFRNNKSLTGLVALGIVCGFAVAGLTEWNFQLCNPMTVALILVMPVLIFTDRKV
ncbi:O-antigen ligase family protein [Butyrivibrio sp. MC2013]|uniref:O-antigen ligase family protein n=1 Tax=Butyrivibrio sp. MC2013 TaxID=1280686 RepID=UPI000418B835|nr:O-antigen ligase family protein [Butyrivibrio sp. MC2013]